MARSLYSPIVTDDVSLVQQRIRDWSFQLSAYVTAFSGWQTDDLDLVQRAIKYWTEAVATVSALGNPAAYEPANVADLGQLQRRFREWSREVV